MLYGKKKGATTFTQVVKIKGTPATGEAGEKIDVTAMDDERTVNIKGRKGTADMSFTYNYTEENYFTKVMPYCNDEIHEFLIKYQDGTGVYIQASAETYINEGSLNSAIEATLNLVPQEVTNKTSAEVTTLLATA